MYSAIIQLCHILSNDFESTPALGAGGSDDLKVGKVRAVVVSLWNWETETTSRHFQTKTTTKHNAQNCQGSLHSCNVFFSSGICKRKLYNGNSPIQVTVVPSNDRHAIAGRTSM